MELCQPVINLTLDKFSLDAIKRINQKTDLGKVLGSAMSFGVISSIFTKSSTPFVAYNITQTDWETYAQAMKFVPLITKAVVQKEIELMQLHYELHYDYQHVLFWNGMRNGCE